MRLSAALILSVACHAQVVTAMQTVRIGIGSNETEALRKINGRWWTQDNREVSPPGKGGMFWIVDSDPGVVEFHHHRPFDLAKAELLHLFESRAAVEATLGEPNRISGHDDHAMWRYYAADGTILWIRFMGEDGLGEAEYRPVHGGKHPVESVALELGGRNIFQVMAQRAAARTRSAPLHRPPAPRLTTVAPAAFEAPRPEEQRIVSRAELSKIKIGAARSDVIAALGEPSTRSAINGGQELRETLIYHLSGGTPVEIRLVDGKVVKIPF
jgi:hypothetical protein